jgi:thymidylate synthase (FAD)
MLKKPVLVAITAPTVEIDGKLLTAEDFIVYAARVSNPSNQGNLETADKLLNYLVKHSHWSPFDMVDMVVELHTSRAIMAQVLRHWSFRFQEFSQRYAAVEAPVSAKNWNHVEARFKAVGGNRQGSEQHDVPMGLSHLAQMACADAAKAYRRLMESDIAPECARMVMPLATPTTAYMKGSVRSWMTYFWQRLDAHAQKEHRELASDLFDIFADQFPTIAQLVATHRPTVIEVTPDWLPTQTP